MASALIVTRERHQPQNSLNRNSIMKKSKKVSARTSYNMLPDYPYAVEVTGDSDGRRQKVQYVKSESIGASGRFDSETASEDSCSLKRKSINLNSAGQKMDALGVPTYVIAVSQMSRGEKMELRKKLKLELDQVRSVAHRIEELQLTSSGSVPTVSDGHISRLANGCPGGIPGKSVIGPGAVHASVVCQKDGGFCRQSSFVSDGSKALNQGPPDGTTWSLERFIQLFQSTLKSHAKGVVAFKSIAAYRSGLNINPLVKSQEAEDGLYKDLCARKPVRISNKSFIDYIFTLSLEVATSFDCPMQIHTGFGDKDLDLRLANPLHLRSILEDDRFKKSRIVLLHASYPYSKEASYLASVYPQIYLDCGLAIPKLSVHGMFSAVKDLLELCPLNKVMFSTDGYAFPETYYLAAKWARKVVVSVLSDACDGGDLSIQEAIEAAQNILRDNAVSFYKLNENSTQNVISEVGTSVTNSQILDLEGNEGKPKFVRLLWVDTSGQQRCRVVPENRFNKVVKYHGVGLTFACMGMSSSSDGPAEGSNLTGVGEIRLMPDMKTLCSLPWSDQEKMVLVDMHLKPSHPWEYCPRTALLRVTMTLEEEFGLVVNAGFESEFYILRKTTREVNNKWVPIDSTPYCSTVAFDAATPVLLEVIKDLQKMHISVEQVHAESGNGQFEIALGHSPCMEAADNLVFVKETIRTIANRNGLLATFIPKYASNDVGSGCHVHLSLWQNGKNKFMAEDGSVTKHGMSTIGEEFMAGVFHHLPSILAFTAPLPNSYERLKPNTWSGAYHCWGKENREAPIRTACPPGISSEVVSNFEIKAFDGCANPYLGLAAVIAAGIDGLRKHLLLPEPVDTNPDYLKEGAVHRLPTSLDESVTELRKNEVLKNLIGDKLMNAVIAVREAEIRYYSATLDNGVEKLIHRY